MQPKPEPLEWWPIECPCCKARVPRGRISVSSRFACPNCDEPLRTTLPWALGVNAAAIIVSLAPGLYFHFGWQYLCLEAIVLWFPSFILVGIIAMVKFPPKLQRSLPNDLTMIKR
jgi:hypothetical protein